jgi:2-polyprenyl-3-methyl-5-hydroxy-6-metoxy-1,4-benzoquinol methylase
VKCAVCGNDTYHSLRKAKLAHLHRCAACGLVSVRKMPAAAELRAVYGEAYFRNARSEESGYEDYEADRYCIVKTAGRRLDLIERYAPERGRLLDVGCALGFFIETARRRGWEVDGVDVSEHATSYAREALGLRARTGTLDEAGYEPASFDVLTLWDVIEHVTDPVATLRHCRALLHDRGLVVLSTPDIGSRVARVAGARWMGFKLAEEHLYYFDRKTLALALEKAGFRVLEMRPMGKDVALDFFVKRLRLYARPLAAVLGGAVDRVGLGRASVYVNPRDILGAVAVSVGGR